LTVSDHEEDREDDTEPCPYCGEPIYDDTVRCPHCEQYLSDEDVPPARRSWWMFLLALLCLAVLLWQALRF
jgi:hypothetical protein